jgi:hypothetical protein
MPQKIRGGRAVLDRLRADHDALHRGLLDILDDVTHPRLVKQYVADLLVIETDLVRYVEQVLEPMLERIDERTTPQEIVHILARLDELEAWRAQQERERMPLLRDVSRDRKP